MGPEKLCFQGPDLKDICRVEGCRGLRGSSDGIGDLKDGTRFRHYHILCTWSKLPRKLITLDYFKHFTIIL